MSPGQPPSGKAASGVNPSPPNLNPSRTYLKFFERVRYFFTDFPQVESNGEKAPEGQAQSKSWRRFGSVVTRASVLDCGCPSAAFCLSVPNPLTCFAWFRAVSASERCLKLFRKSEVLF